MAPATFGTAFPFLSVPISRGFLGVGGMFRREGKGDSAGQGACRSNADNKGKGKERKIVVKLCSGVVVVIVSDVDRRCGCNGNPRGLYPF